MNLVRSSRFTASLSSNHLFRAAALVLLCANLAFAQLPRAFYAWWSSPVAKDMNLSPGQRQQIRNIVQEYRNHLIDVKAQVEKAEGDLEFQFEQETVDTRKANEAIIRLAAARSELTKSLTEMSLKLRVILTQQQWQELQLRRPMRGQAAGAAAPNTR